MRRRVFLLGFTAVALALPSLAVSASANARRFTDAFVELDRLFRALRDAAKGHADWVKREKLARLLRPFSLPLADVRKAKRSIKLHLERSNCTRPSIGPTGSEGMIVQGLRTLSGLAGDLSRAVKPGDMEAACTAIRTNIDEIIVQKQWLSEWRDYCDKQPEERQTYLDEIDASVTAVDKAAGSLTRLLAVLGK